MSRVSKTPTEHDGSEFVKHLACPACGSRDANALFTDGHTYCFSCGKNVRGEGTESETPNLPPANGCISGEFQALRARKIDADTCKKFGYRVGTYKGRQVQIAPYYDSDGRLVAQKLRNAKKKFAWVGDSKAKTLPFGAQAWPRTGKMIVVTEGEIDALSMSQVQGNKYPVVSVGCGAGPQVQKYFARHLEYFLGFDTVVLMFDQDEPGQEAAKVAASVIGARARIADLPLKDANEMLVAGRVQELLNAMWRAREYRPEGVLDMADLKDKVLEDPPEGLSWPWPSLTALTYGVRLREIHTLGAGTGIGKTDCYTEVIKHFVVEHKKAVGVFSLEQPPVETAKRVAGKLAGKPFHIPKAAGGWTDADMDAAWETLMSSGRVFLYDSFGRNEWDTVQEKIEYLHHANDVRYFFVDHLTALASGDIEERVELERIMMEMGGLVQRLGITIFLVSHLATPEGKPHEEGGRVMLRHLKGSRSIAQWSHYAYGLERNQQAEDPDVRMTTTFRVLKDRHTGRATGKVFHLGYDAETGLLFEREAPGEGAKHGFKDETDIPTGTTEGDF